MPVNNNVANSATPRTPPSQGITASASPAPAARVDASTRLAKADGFENVPNVKAPSAEPPPDTAGPSVLRALFATASRIQDGEVAGKTAVEAAKVLMASPEMFAAFKHALPALESAATAINPAVGKVAKAALPLVANGETTKALLKIAGEAAGPSGRRLVGAALRGLHQGGLANASAEVAATAAKLGMKAGAAGGVLGGVAKGLGKAAPLVGNAANLLCVGTSIAGLLKSFKDPGASLGMKLAHALHLAASVAGCFIPPVGVVGDLAMVAVKSGNAR